MAFVKLEFRGSTILSSHFFGFLFTLLAGFFGNWIALFISEFTANLIGAIVLGIIGVFILCQPFLGQRNTVGSKDGNVLMGILRDPEKADFDGSKTISFSEAIVLGIALSINNIAGGFDAGVTNLNLWLTATISGVFSFICISGFAYVGKTIFSRILREMGYGYCGRVINSYRDRSVVVRRVENKVRVFPWKYSKGLHISTYFSPY